MADLTTIEGRSELIKVVTSKHNQRRKDEAKSKYEIFKGKIETYVRQELARIYHSKEKVKNMPVVSSMNFAKRIIDEKARLYNNPPERSYVDLTDSEAVENIYEDLNLDTVLLSAHKLLELQGQVLIQIIPKNGVITTKTLKKHQFDLIGKPDDPTVIEKVVITSFDRNKYNLLKAMGSTPGTKSLTPQEIKRKCFVFTVWTTELNFKMDGDGELLTAPEDIGSPVPGVLPFIDIYKEKDFDVYADHHESLTEFTVKYAAQLSIQSDIVKFQGFAQPYYKGPAELIQNGLELGQDKVLLLPTDDLEGGSSVEFGFESPNTDLQGVYEHAKMLLDNFLQAENIDKATFAQGVMKHNSAADRMLSMIQDYEKSRSVMPIFKRVESQIFKVVAAWHNALRDTDLLSDEYVGPAISDSAYINTEFRKPEMLMTEVELTDLMCSQEAKGYTDRVGAIMRIKGMTETEAVQFLENINTRSPQEEPIIQEEENEQPEI